MNEEQQKHAVAIENTIKYLTLYESHRPVPHASPDNYLFLATALKREIETKNDLPLLRSLGERYPVLQHMLADVVWNSRISRNRRLHCPDLDALMNRLTAR